MILAEAADNIVWIRLKEGNELAFRQLYDRYVDKLISYGYRFTSDHQVLEDCCQELFVRLWKKREQLPDLDKPSSYLYKSMRNNLVKQLKRTENKYIGGVDEYVFDWVPAVDEEILDDERHDEQLQMLKDALEALPSRQKEAIYLKFQKGLEYDEICEIMDINYQSARNFVSRAIQTMRDILTLFLFGLLNFWF